MASEGGNLWDWLLKPEEKLTGAASYTIDFFIAHKAISIITAVLGVILANELARRAIKKGNLGREFVVFSSTKLEKVPNSKSGPQLYDLKLKTLQKPFEIKNIFDKAFRSKMHKHFKRAAKLSGDDPLYLNYLEEAINTERMLWFIPKPKFLRDDYDTIKKAYMRSKFNYFAPDYNIPEHDQALDEDGLAKEERVFFVHADEEGAQFKEFKTLEIYEELLTMTDFPEREHVRVQNLSSDFVLNTEEDPQQHMDRYDLLVQARSEYQEDKDEFIKKYGVLINIHKDSKRNAPNPKI